MNKFFNTAGPMKADLHYLVDPLHRWELEEVLTLIRQQKYFVVHAPRQTGKTSCLFALRDYLNEKGEFLAVYANIEPAQAAREDVTVGIRTVMGGIASRLRYDAHTSLLYNEWATILHSFGAGQALNEMLSFWAVNSEKPIVLMLDEVDALVGDTLISLLRQIRSGYGSRPKGFPSSIILCGVRDVRDYRIHSDKEKSIITGGSAFNIKAESLRLGNFNLTDIRNLYAQHTQATGQVFEEEIYEQVYDYTGGQPWLVNALAQEATYGIRENRNYEVSISRSAIEMAKENLIIRRDTHLEQLTDKLQEERVKRVIQPILQTEGDIESLKTDDIQYCIDLGLVKRTAENTIEISNDIYKEIIPRELTFDTQVMLHQPSSWYIMENGRLDMDKLLSAFQQFFRENSEHWIKRFQYQEAGPQLLLQAFLQRVVNGGGIINREYGLGRGRTDLFLKWMHPHGVQKVVFELKILRNSLEKTVRDGLLQTFNYMDKCAAEQGHLIIFDRSENKTWEEKIYSRLEEFQGKKIKIWGC